MTDPERRYRIEQNQPPSVAVVRAVATVEDVPPVDLEPLETAVNTDALDELLGGRRVNQYRFSFDYAGHRIVVTDGHVVVREGERNRR